MQGSSLYVEISLPAFFSIQVTRFQTKLLNLVQSNESHSHYKCEKYSQATIHITTGSMISTPDNFLGGIYGIEAFKPYKVYFDDFFIDDQQEISFRAYTNVEFVNQFYSKIPNVQLTPPTRYKLCKFRNLSLDSVAKLKSKFSSETFSFDFDHTSISATISTNGQSYSEILYLTIDNDMSLRLKTKTEIAKSENWASERLEILRNISLTRQDGPQPNSQTNIIFNSQSSALGKSTETHCLGNPHGFGLPNSAQASKSAVIAGPAAGMSILQSSSKSQRLETAIELQSHQKKLNELRIKLLSLDNDDNNDSLGALSAQISAEIENMALIVEKNMNGSLSQPPPTIYEDNNLAVAIMNYMDKKKICELQHSNNQDKIALEFFGRNLPPIMQGYSQQKMIDLLSKLNEPDTQQSAFTQSEIHTLLALSLISKDVYSVLPYMLHTQHKVQKETAHINKPVNPPVSEGSQPAASTGGATAQVDLFDQTVNQTVNQTANLSILSDIDNNTICE